MSESEKPQDAAPEAPRLVIWRSAAEKAVADLQWRLDQAVELANERQAEIDALKRGRRSPLMFFAYHQEDYCKCSGCCGLFPREATTEKDGALFCPGCLANEELAEIRDKHAEQIRSQADTIKTMEARAELLLEANRSLGEHSEQRIKALQEQIALLKAAAMPIEKARAPLGPSSILQAMADREKAMQAAEAIPAEPVTCWYRAPVPRGWSAGWLLVDGPLKLVAIQDGHVRWCHPSNVTTTEPKFP